MSGNPNPAFITTAVNFAPYTAGVTVPGAQFSTTTQTPSLVYPANFGSYSLYNNTYVSPSSCILNIPVSAPIGSGGPTFLSTPSILNIPVCYTSSQNTVYSGRVTEGPNVTGSGANTDQQPGA